MSEFPKDTKFELKWSGEVRDSWEPKDRKIFHAFYIISDYCQDFVMSISAPYGKFESSTDIGTLLLTATCPGYKTSETFQTRSTEAESVWKLVDKFTEKYSRSKYPQISEATVSAFKVLSSAVSGGGHQQNADAISNWRHRIVTTVSQLQKRCREEKNVDFMNETAGLMRDFVKIQNVSIAAAYVNDVPTDSHLSLLD
eukprot:1051413_1